jgi:acetyl-CoA C-acetyltransferase
VNDHARVPVIIGVGQVTNRGEDESPDPLELARRALVEAATDTGGVPTMLERLDRVDVVNIVSWSYGDVAAELGARVGAKPSRTAHSAWGGNQPTLLVDRAAEQIAAGEVRLAAVAGAESFRSLERAMKSGAMPDWPPPPPHAPPPPDAKSVVPAVAWEHGLRMPVDVYPVYENARRVAAGESLAESQAWAARMWSRMSDVAARNDGAWNPTPMTPEQIETVSATNRMVSFPYPKLMNALLSVDQAAAVLLADTETARELGVPEEQWVYPHGGAGANDPEDILARVSYARAPAMELVLDDIFPAAGVSADAIDLLELYSCFPCVPKMALTHLGWDRDRPMSVTGGLTFFGGAGNDYMGHALVAMVRALREGEGATGLLYGQGGFVTKHHALVVAAAPREGGYPVGGVAADAARQARVDALESPRLELAPVGDATIEGWTVTYERGGDPETGLIVGRLADGARFVATTPPGDRDQLDRLVGDDADLLDRPGTVGAAGDGRNEFRLR